MQISKEQSTSHLEIMSADNRYIRERLNPQPGDLFYLHLADLLMSMESIKTDQAIKILDYGAGVSPYQVLFQNCEYRRADIGVEAGADYLISMDGTVPEKSETFDLILSTQVLEHVANPNDYIAECFRLLKPGGKAVITTHGLFEDHGCPYDFYRWTGDGLRRDLENAGFEILSLNKLTTGPRAILYFLDRYLDTMPESRRGLPSLLHFILNTITRPFRKWIHILSDRYYSNRRVVPSDIPYNNFYIALFAYAHRPCP